MPVTGPGTFDSTEASAFADQLAATRDLATLDAALTAPRAGGRLPLVLGAQALVAAEVVAAARGAATPTLPPGLASWVADGVPVTEMHRDVALDALAAVRSDDSELCEVAPLAWPTWATSLDDLASRLLA